MEEGSFSGHENELNRSEMMKTKQFSSLSLYLLISPNIIYINDMITNQNKHMYIYETIYVPHITLYIYEMREREKQNLLLILINKIVELK